MRTIKIILLTLIVFFSVELRAQQKVEYSFIHDIDVNIIAGNNVNSNTIAPGGGLVLTYLMYESMYVGMGFNYSVNVEARNNSTTGNIFAMRIISRYYVSDMLFLDFEYQRKYTEDMSSNELPKPYINDGWMFGGIGYSNQNNADIYVFGLLLFGSNNAYLENKISFSMELGIGFSL